MAAISRRPSRTVGRAGASMHLTVGHIVYRMVVVQGPIRNTCGEELCGYINESERLIVLSGDLPLDQRRETALHEFVHAWRFVAPFPTNDEDLCEFTTFIVSEWENQLSDNGGPTAIEAMPTMRIPSLKTYRTQFEKTIRNADPTILPGLRKLVLEAKSKRNELRRSQAATST